MAGAKDAASAILRAHGVHAAIAFRLDATDSALGDEGYRLSVVSTGITISARTGAGAFYAVQTLDELLPYGAAASTMPAVVVTDAPRYRWRGIHLDVSRHFFPVDTIERYIDVAAHYKLNVFHWHLTDDQGWRLQIKRYPLLTSIGGCRAGTMRDHDATDIDVHRYCGYYTQDEVRAVVAYARARHVTVVPEIEMPGHSDAAIAAYPWLSCNGERIGTRETWGVSTHIYCPTDRTFAFLENVLTEVLQLFPSEYVHTGGDEVPKDEWMHSAAVHRLMQREHLASYDAVQGYFDRRIERFLRAHGRRMIGWDEILDGGVTPTAAIMAWQSVARGEKAIALGHPTIMSPDGLLYFDALQGDENDEPESIGGLTTPQMVYDVLPPAGALGIQANLWTEYISTENHLFYMLLPRLLPLAEIAWSDERPRDWSAYAAREGAQFDWLMRRRYPFRIPNPQFTISNAGAVSYDSVCESVRDVCASTAASSATVAIADEIPGATMHYTLDGSAPTAASPKYAAPIDVPIATNVAITAVAVLPGGRTSTPTVLRLRKIFP